MEVMIRRSTFILMLFFIIPPAAATTSVVIPCHYKHAQHLYQLLQHFEHQTVLPHEVVIVISEYKKVNQTILDDLNNTPWLFPVKIILSEHVQFAGQNRNTGCRNAIGDILILQDADDIPHPQRIEIINYFFEKYHLDHLMHQFFMADSQQKRILFKPFEDFDQIQIAWPHAFSDVIAIKGFTNGNIALSKEVFNKINWTDLPSGQDQQFNIKVYSEFNNLLLLKIPLITYRRFLSSHATP